jgi:hypothetical protein
MGRKGYRVERASTKDNGCLRGAWKEGVQKTGCHKGGIMDKKPTTGGEGPKARGRGDNYTGYKEQQGRELIESALRLAADAPMVGAQNG